MVVHRRDDPRTSITDLLTAVRECEENQENNRRSRRLEYARSYPPSTSRPSYGGPPNDNRPQEPSRQNNRYPPRQDKTVAIHAANVEAGPVAGEGDYQPPYTDHEQREWGEDAELELYTEFYAAAVRLADDTERRDNRCFN